MYTFSFNFILLLAVLLWNGVLAFWVFRTNPASATNRVFALLSLFASFWLAANYISLQPNLGDATLLWIRATITLAVPVTSALFLLAHTIPYTSLRLTRFGLFLLIACTGLVMAVAASPYAFQSVVIEPNGLASPQVAPGIAFFGLFVVGLIGASLVVLIKKFQRFKTIERRQILFMIVGIAGTWGAIAVTIVFLVAIFHITFFVPFSPAYMLFFLLMTAYAIIRHHLFTLEVIATELFTTLIVSITFINIFLAHDQNSFLVNLTIFVGVLIFGVFLVRGTLKEIRALEEISRAKSEFVSIASHQLRTPLTATKGYVSMLLEGSYGELSESVRRALSMVYASNERLVRIVNDLLDISRMESGKFQYTFAKVSLADLLGSVVKELAIAAEIKKLDLIWEVPTRPERFTVSADEEKLRQTFLNILDNAIKYTQKGSIAIKLAQDVQPGHFRVSVKDTGIGISGEDQSKLFEQFVRGKEGSSANAVGSGIGLYIAKKIVADHQGRIWAESEGSWKGSTFIVTLPAYRQAPVSTQTPAV